MTKTALRERFSKDLAVTGRRLIRNSIVVPFFLMYLETILERRIISWGNLFPQNAHYALCFENSVVSRSDLRNIAHRFLYSLRFPWFHDTCVYVCVCALSFLHTYYVQTYMHAYIRTHTYIYVYVLYIHVERYHITSKCWKITFL